MKRLPLLRGIAVDGVLGFEGFEDAVCELEADLAGDELSEFALFGGLALLLDSEWEIMVSRERAGAPAGFIEVHTDADGFLELPVQDYFNGEGVAVHGD